MEFGAIVKTGKGNYFFSIAYGKIEVNGESIFCLSPVSPIGKVLSGKQAGDKVLFQGQEIQVKTIG